MQWERLQKNNELRRPSLINVNIARLVAMKNLIYFHPIMVQDLFETTFINPFILTTLLP